MRIHHVAYVTRNIEQRAGRLIGLFSCRLAGPIVIDEGQGVRIQFLEMEDGSLLELLEPYGANSPVERHLKKGGGIYHLCFEVSDLNETLQRLQATGDAIVVREPTPAPAIDNRRVAFVVTADQDLFELVETPQQ
jgi:methylmalonyl-CoA/ethylmalonyl-CoA epimerase